MQRISQNQLINSTWTSVFYGHDGDGSVRTLADATGTVTDTYDYDAWGNIVNSTGSTSNEFLYRSEQHDPDLGLYYLRARYFSPVTGRFLTIDPAEGSVTDPASLHKYLYAGADPINQMDPTGRSTITDPNKKDSDKKGSDKAGFLMYDPFAEYLVLSPGDISLFQFHAAPSKKPDEWGADPVCKDGSGDRRKDISLEEKKKCCKDAPPMTADGPSSYGPNDRYNLIPAKCMFLCGGDGPWGNLIRGCLACMHGHQNGYSYGETNAAHWYCYQRGAERLGKRYFWQDPGFWEAVDAALACFEGEIPPRRGLLPLPMPFPSAPQGQPIPR